MSIFMALFFLETKNDSWVPKTLIQCHDNHNDISQIIEKLTDENSRLRRVKKNLPTLIRENPGIPFTVFEKGKINV